MQYVQLLAGNILLLIFGDVQLVDQTHYYRLNSLI